MMVLSAASDSHVLSFTWTLEVAHVKNAPCYISDVLG